MKVNDEIKVKIDREKLADFCRRHEVAELALFGSALREDFGPESDVDVLVTFLPGAKVSLFDLVDMADELTKLMGRKVDLVTKQGLKPLIRRSVVESAVIVYEAA